MVSLTILDSVTNSTSMCVHAHYQTTAPQVTCLRLHRSAKSSPRYVLSKFKSVLQNPPRPSTRLSVLRKLQLTCMRFLSHDCRLLIENVCNFQRPALSCCQQTVYDSWKVVSCRQLGEDIPDRGIISPFQYVVLGYTPFELVTDLSDSNDIP